MSRLLPATAVPVASVPDGGSLGTTGQALVRPRPGWQVPALPSHSVLVRTVMHSTPGSRPLHSAGGLQTRVAPSSRCPTRARRSGRDQVVRTAHRVDVAASSASPAPSAAFRIGRLPTWGVRHDTCPYPAPNARPSRTKLTTRYIASYTLAQQLGFRCNQRLTITRMAYAGAACAAIYRLS